MPVCQVNEKTVQGCVCVRVFQTVLPVLAHAGRKVGQFIRPFNPLSAKPIIWVLLLLFYSTIYSYI